MKIRKVNMKYSTIKDFKKALEIVKDDGWALLYASEELKDNSILVLEAIKSSDWALSFASERIKSSIAFAKQAITLYPTSLAYFSDSIKNNKEIVEIALKQNGLIFEHVGKDLQFDTELIKLSIQQNGSSIKFIEQTREYCVLAVQQKGLALKFINDTYRNNRTVVAEAVKENIMAIIYSSYNMKRDPYIIKIVENKLDYLKDHIDDYEFCEFLNIHTFKIKEDILSSLSNHTYSLIRKAIVDRPDFIPTKAQLINGLNDKSEIVREAYELKKDTVYQYNKIIE